MLALGADLDTKRASHSNCPRVQHSHARTHADTHTRFVLSSLRKLLLHLSCSFLLICCGYYTTIRLLCQ